MRVLFIDHSAQPGGAELCLVETVRHVRAESEVVLFDDGPLRPILDDAGAAVHIEPAPSSILGVRREGRAASLRAAIGVLRLGSRLAVRARRFDALYANTQKSMIVAAVAGVLARRPVVWHLHDLLTQEHFGRGQVRAAVGVARSRVQRVIANSNATRDAYVAAGGRPDHVTVVYNGIDAEPFDRVSQTDVRRARDQLGLGRAPVVGLFGRLAPWKGHEVLLEALVDLPEVHALIVGGALFDSDRDHPAFLRARVRDLGLAGRVHETGFRDDVPTLMRACDVIVHASTAAEPFGRVIVEAMLAGRPVVASNAGGARELVNDGVTGVLVVPGDSGALGVAIRSLLANPDRAAGMARAARDAARVRFNPVEIGARITSIVGEAVKGSPRLSP